MGGEQADTSPSNRWWWVPNAVFAGAGLGLVALGVLTRTADSHDLVVAGVAVITAAAGHAAGKQSPTP